VKTLFHPGLYRFDQPQPSYREASAGASDLQDTPLPKHLPAIVRGRPPRFPLAFYDGSTRAPASRITGCVIFSISSPQIR
jgi:hypothetical protein